MEDYSYLNCNYDVDKLTSYQISTYELLLWWSKLRDVVNREGESRYIIFPKGLDSSRQVKSLKKSTKPSSYKCKSTR